jgi:hypothetical protein
MPEGNPQAGEIWVARGSTKYDPEAPDVLRVNRLLDGVDNSVFVETTGDRDGEDSPIRYCTILEDFLDDYRYELPAMKVPLAPTEWDRLVGEPSF